MSIHTAGLSKPGWLIGIPFFGLLFLMPEELGRVIPYSLYQYTLNNQLFFFIAVMNTPPKTHQHVEPSNGSLENDVPFQRNDFEVLAASFRGGIYIYISLFKEKLPQPFPKLPNIIPLCGIFCQILQKLSPS